MDNSLSVNQRFQPTFGTVHGPKNLENMLPSRRTVAEYIIAALKKVDPDDILGRTYEKIADDAGYDIFVRDNNKRQAIRVDAVTKRAAEDYINNDWDVFDSQTFVNFYKTSNEFNPNQVSRAVEKNIKQEKDKKVGRSLVFLVITALTTICGGSLWVKCHNDKAAAQAMAQDTTELVTNAGKAVKGTVQELPDTAFKNVKNAVKSVK